MAATERTPRTLASLAGGPQACVAMTRWIKWIGAASIHVGQTSRARVMMWVSALVQVAGLVARSRKVPQLLVACLSILARSLKTIAQVREGRRGLSGSRWEEQHWSSSSGACRGTASRSSSTLWPQPCLPQQAGGRISWRIGLPCWEGARGSR